MSAARLAQPSGHILLVEDEPHVRFVTRRMLERIGLQVTEAENATQALEEFGHHGSYELVLVDMSMPDFDGLTLAGRMRDQSPDQRILLISGDPSAVANRGEGAGHVDAFLKKPYSAASLLNAIQQARERVAESAPVKPA